MSYGHSWFQWARFDVRIGPLLVLECGQ